MIDATDVMRLVVAKDELDSMLKHKDMETSRAPILFFANKMDLAGALEPVDSM